MNRHPGPCKLTRFIHQRKLVAEDIFVHKSSFVDAGCSIGARTKVWHFCHVMAGARIGEGCTLGQNVFVAPDVVIGNNVRVQNNVFCTPGLSSKTMCSAVRRWCLPTS